MIDLSTYRPVSFSSCENPYMIRDTHGHLQKVRCGVCPQCKQSSKNRTSSLLQLEIKNWKYCIFFTLTYNNHWLPKVRTFRDDCGFLRLRPIGRAAKLLKYYPDYAEYDYKLVNSVYAKQEDTYHNVYIPKIENYSNTNDFGILLYSDIQLFKKRFIKNYFKYVKKQCPSAFDNGYPKYKFFYCGEYGTTTYRPHFHLLFLFDDYRLCTSLSTFRNFVYNNWSCRTRRKKGFNRFKISHFANYRRFTLPDEVQSPERPNFSFVDTSETSAVSSYVSSYVSSASNLPSVLQFKPWCAKTITPRGKFGSFGSHENEANEVMQKVAYLETRPKVFFHYGDYFQKTEFVFQNKSQSFEPVTLPYSNGLIRTLFCKPFGYSQISHKHLQSIFKTVFINVTKAFSRYKKLGEFYSFDEFISSSDFRPIVINELLDTKDFSFFYRLGVLQESFWLFLRNGFRTMYRYNLKYDYYLKLFFFVHDVLLPQCRLCKFYQEQDLLITNGFDVSCMYDNLSEAPKVWFNTFPIPKISKDLLLSCVHYRFENILFTHKKHHSRSNF